MTRFLGDARMLLAFAVAAVACEQIAGFGELPALGCFADGGDSSWSGGNSSGTDGRAFGGADAVAGSAGTAGTRPLGEP